MIDYNVLCQTIEDWKAGRRPSAPIPGPTPAAPSAAYEQVDSGLVMMDGEGGYAPAADGAYEGGYDDAAAYGEPAPEDSSAGQAAYADDDAAYGEGGSFVEQSYGDPISVSQGGEGYEGDDDAGAPSYVAPTVTPRVEQPQDPPPYAASEAAPHTEMIPTEDGDEAPVEAYGDDNVEPYDEDLDLEVDEDDDEPTPAP
jgi:hypothetical protein